MRIRIDFEEIPELEISSVHVIGSFNGYDSAKGAMQKEGTTWTTELILPPGEHYYKFLINEAFLLNDSKANLYLPHKEDGLWSVIKIDEDDQRLYNNEAYAVHMQDYAMSGGITEEEIKVNKKLFHLLMDKQQTLRLTFDGMSGLHAVTVVWYDSRGDYYQAAENSLFSDESKEEVILWYWLDLTELERDRDEGRWTVRVFVDGSYILEDYFDISSTTIYSRESIQGKTR